MTAIYRAGRVETNGVYALDKASVEEMSVGFFHLTRDEDVKVLARMLRRVVEMLEPMGLGAGDDVKDRGTPTPSEATPATPGKDTLMERSIDKEQEVHPPVPSKKISETGPSSYSPNIRVDRSTAPLKKYTNLKGSSSWDPTCGLSMPAGLSADDQVDVVLRGGWVGFDHRVGDLWWGVCSDDYEDDDDEIVRYRRHVPETAYFYLKDGVLTECPKPSVSDDPGAVEYPDNAGGDGFGPDRVEGSQVDLIVSEFLHQLTAGGVVSSNYRWYAEKSLRVALSRCGLL